MTLRIEHSVPSFDAWKEAFDRDPADRRGAGVRRYRISRPVDDPNFVTIDLEFDSIAAAEGLLTQMRQIWAGPGSAFIVDPKARVLQTVDAIEL